MSGDFLAEANSPDNTEVALHSETEDIIELGSDSESDGGRGDLVSADIEGTDHDNEDHGSVSTDTEGSEVPLINAADTWGTGHGLVQGFKPVMTTYGELEIVDRFEEDDDEEVHEEEEQKQEELQEEQEDPEEHLVHEEQEVQEQLTEELYEEHNVPKEREEQDEQLQRQEEVVEEPEELLEQDTQDDQETEELQQDTQQELEQEEDKPADISHYLDTELQAWAGLDEVVPGSDDEQIGSGPAGDNSSVPYADLEQLNSGQTPDVQLIQQTQNLDLDSSASHIQWTDEGCSPSTASDHVSVMQEGSDIPSMDLSNQMMVEFDTNNSSVSQQMAPDDGLPSTGDPEEHPEQQPSETMEDNELSFHMDRNTGQILPFENLEIEIVLESDLARQNEHSTGTTAEQDQDKMVRKHLLII